MGQPEAVTPGPDNWFQVKPWFSTMATSWRLQKMKGVMANDLDPTQGTNPLVWASAATVSSVLWKARLPVSSPETEGSTSMVSSSIEKCWSMYLCTQTCVSGERECVRVQKHMGMYTCKGK